MTGEGAPIVLRAATAADAPDVAVIWHLGWQDGHRGFVPDELADARTEASFHQRAGERVGETTVATIGDAVAGFIMVVDDEAEQVYVSREHRGGGVAATLITEAERQIGSAGHDRAWLAVVAGNARARAFYARSGWKDEGLFHYAADDHGTTIPVPCHRYTRAVSTDTP